MIDPNTDHMELGPDGDFWGEEGPASMKQRKEIERRNKAYPRLVAALRESTRILHNRQVGDRQEDCDDGLLMSQRALLRELGEAE